MQKNENRQDGEAYNDVAAVNLVTGVLLEHGESLLGLLVSAVNQPSVGVQQGVGAEVLVGVPPVARATVSGEGENIHGGKHTRSRRRRERVCVRA